MNTRNTIYHIIIITCISWLMLLTSSCSRQEPNPQHATLAAIDDSIGAKSPAARKMIDEAIRHSTDSLSYYECLARLAKYYMLSPTPDSAKPIIDNTERFIGKPKTNREKSLLAFVLNSKAGYMHNFHKGTTQSIDIYKKAYELLMQSDDKDQAPNVCANLGDAYVYEDDLPKAASWYRRALFLTDSLQMPEKENLTFYMGLALIYQQLGDDKRALNLYKQSDRQFNDMTVSMQAYFLNNYGSFYYYRKEYKNSLQLFLRLKKFLEQHNMTNNFDMYLCKLNLSDVYLNLMNYKEAEKYLDEAEPFWKSTGDPAAMYYCSSIRLGIALQKGDMTLAGKIVKDDDTGKGVMDAMRLIRNRYVRFYYEKTGNWHAAYVNLKNENLQTDSMDHRQANMRSNDIINQYTQDTLQLHNDLRMELKETEVSRTRMWLVVAVSAFLVLLLAFLVLSLREHRRKLRIQMQVMQLRLESARNRISPHFVFNVLNNRIVEADNKEADELMNLTKLIRANLDMAGKLAVSLADELGFVDKYVKVESKLLADDEFTYKVNIDDGIEPEKIMIPSMTIQILVENAFVHALMGRTGMKILTINVTRKDNNIVIAVLDNGPGFDIRSTRFRSRTGLNVVRQTIAAINEHNKHQKIHFSMHNRTGADGKVAGCESTITIPDGIDIPS